jgi:tRNA pseudouridine(55) synthase
MEKVLRLWKKAGQTPLDVIDALRQEKPEYIDQKITYAGRLDPLAEGEMILLVGEEVHNKQQYLDLEKEYEVDILLGVSTDSFDTLGLVLEEGVVSAKWFEKTEKYIEKHVGEFEQKYPPFSSKTVDGKPMFQLTKDKVEFEIPTHKVKMVSAEILEDKIISKEELIKLIQEKNSVIKGDFRQVEIGDRWNDYFDQTEYIEYPVVTIKMRVGSGFYVRQFADDLGKYLGSNALALHIKRTKIFMNTKS